MLLVKLSGLPPEQAFGPDNATRSIPMMVAMVIGYLALALAINIVMFGDLYQAGVSSVGMGDLVLSVLATVIGHQKAKGWIIVDAGWMALSRDRSTAKQALDQGYGMNG